MIFWEKLRAEMGRYADGVHEVGAPVARAQLEAAEARLARKLPHSLGELYRSFDGLRLFTDSFVIHGAEELALDGDRVRFGEALGAPLRLDEAGRVYELDEAGDAIVCGSDVARFLDAVMAREKLVVDRDGEYKDVFAEGGELGDEARKKRARAGLKCDPQSAAWLLESAELAFEDGREDDARAELERAVEADPHAGPAWILLGALHQRAGRRAEAAEAYRHSAESTRDAARRAERFAEAARAAEGESRERWAAAARAADSGAAERWAKEAEEQLAEGDSDGALHLAELAEVVAPGSAAAVLPRARVRNKLKLV